MRVRITQPIDGRLGPDRYAYYPGQVIVDHEHEAEWLERGQAVPLAAPLETALATTEEDAIVPASDSTTPPVDETRRGRRK